MTALGDWLTVLVCAIAAMVIFLAYRWDVYRWDMRDQRERADAAERDAGWWKSWAEEREREADMWRKKALDLQEQARAAERKQLQEAFEPITRSEAKALTVESASNEILWLYDEALASKVGSGAQLFPGSPFQYVVNMLAEGTSRARRERMASLVRFLADRAREAEEAKSA